MSVLNPIISGIVYLIEMLISYVFFANISEKQKTTTRCFIIGTLLFGICFIANLFFKNDIWVNLMVFTSVNLIFAVSCFSLTFFSSLFYSVILSVLCGALEFASIFTVSAFTKSTSTGYLNNYALFILECPISKILYFLVTLVLSKIANKKGCPVKVPINLLLYPLSSTVCLSIVWFICTQEHINHHSQYLLAIASLIILGSTVLLFITYQHQLEKDRELITLKSEYNRLQYEKSYYDILERQNQQLMIYAHDAKNHLAIIHRLNTDPALSSYITKLSEQLSHDTRNCHSGNRLLDVMIDKYILDCEIKGLSFDYDIKSCNLGELEDIDLVAILGNLVDNAIAAAEKSEKKQVSLETAKRNTYSVLIISNSCDIAPKVKGHRLITSKEDQEIHGYGLKSVAATLKKYQGDFDWIYDSDSHLFTITVMIGENER